MAQLRYAVNLIDATGLVIRSPAGRVAYQEFETRAEAILKESMNAARKALRQAAPTRTRKLQRSLRVARVYRRRHELGRIVIGFQVTTGRKQFYASITDHRERTRVSRWFTKALEEIQESPDFDAWQDEIISLFANVIRVEFKETVRTSLRARIIARFPRAKLISEGPDHSLIRVEINADGRGRER